MSSWKNNNNDQILSEINMIIFMITSSVQLESGLKIDLPETTSESAKVMEPIVISIEKSGRFYFKGNYLNQKILEEELKLEVAKSELKEVILEGDKSVKLEKLVDIMDMASRVGALSFTIATKN